MGTNFASYANMTDLMTAIGNKLKALNGAYVFKGSTLFAGLPATLTQSMTGYVYNITEDFVTDSRFVEGAGKKYSAGTNIAVANVGAGTSVDMKFDVISDFVDVDAINNAIKAVSAMITAPFDATASYNTGDFCTYNGNLYVFTADHSAGAWTGSDATATTVIAVINAFEQAINAKTNAIVNSIAPTFDTTTAYDEGDLVMYENALYKFTAAHAAGAWSTSDTAPTTVADAIDAVVTTFDGKLENLSDSIADAFDATATYAIGDIVMYENKLYKFTAAHTGAWAPADVTATTVEALVTAAEPDALTNDQITALIALLD